MKTSEIRIFENPQFGKIRTAGTSDELAIQPREVTAVWAVESGLHGVSYAGSTRTGFFEVPGVTVKEPATPPVIVTTALPNGTVNTNYSKTLEVTGNTPITWSIESGTLPTGLSLNATTGVISGTPTAAGSSSFTVKATNDGGNGTKQLSITISAAPQVPQFVGLADEYQAGSPPVPLQAINIGTVQLTVFKVNGVTATEFNPSAAGVYLVEAFSADGTLRIWKYVKVK